MLAPADFRTEHSPQAAYLIALPHSWNDYVWEGEGLGGQGYAMFRLLVNMGKQDMGRHLALRMPTIFHSYKLWVDGELAVEVGKVGVDETSVVPSLATHLIYVQPQTERMEIIMQVANFHHARGGITKHIELGDSQKLTTKMNMKMLFEMFVIASLFVIGAYHLMLYAHRRKDKASLYFGLFSVMWCLRSLFTGELIGTKLFPDFPWVLQYKLEYLVLYGGAFIFTMYFYHLFKEESPRWFRMASGIMTALFSIIVIVTPAVIYTRTLQSYGLVIAFHLAFFLYALTRATMKRKEGAVVFLVASVLAVLAMINDFLYYTERLLIGSTSDVGLFIFLMAQMYLLSSRFAKTAANEEQAALELAAMNNKLLHVNQNLEQLVVERTSELLAAHEHLRDAYDRLLHSEEGRKKLLSYITHDLKTPLSTMLGFVEAVQDNINPDKNPRYLKYVYEKTVWLNRMIEDLSFLSQLETSQVSFAKRAMRMEEVVREFWQHYEPVIQDAGLRSECSIARPPGHQAALQVWADPQRLEQVLSNFLSNALKFTQPGGTIGLSLAYEDMQGVLHAVIGIADTGIGIPPERLDHIFERNYKHYPQGFELGTMGSGLGLAIAKEIVEAHDGQIWAESSGKDGSTFYLAIPVMTEDHAQEGEQDEATHHHNRGR